MTRVFSLASAVKQEERGRRRRIAKSLSNMVRFHFIILTKVGDQGGKEENETGEHKLSIDDGEITSRL